MAYRYNNILLECMTSVTKNETEDGRTIIYVKKCTKFKPKKFKSNTNNIISLIEDFIDNN